MVDPSQTQALEFDLERLTCTTDPSMDPSLHQRLDRNSIWQDIRNLTVIGMISQEHTSLSFSEFEQKQRDMLGRVIVSTLALPDFSTGTHHKFGELVSVHKNNGNDKTPRQMVARTSTPFAVSVKIPGPELLADLQRKVKTKSDLRPSNGEKRKSPTYRTLTVTAGDNIYAVRLDEELSRGDQIDAQIAASTIATLRHQKMLGHEGIQVAELSSLVLKNLRAAGQLQSSNWSKKRIATEVTRLYNDCLQYLEFEDSHRLTRLIKKDASNRFSLVPDPIEVGVKLSGKLFEGHFSDPADAFVGIDIDLSEDAEPQAQASQLDIMVTRAGLPILEMLLGKTRFDGAGHVEAIRALDIIMDPTRRALAHKYGSHELGKSQILKVHRRCLRILGWNSYGEAIKARTLRSGNRAAITIVQRTRLDSQSATNKQGRKAPKWLGKVDQADALVGHH